jgi:hypothetical protein
VCGAFFDHLQHAIEYTYYRAKGLVLSFIKSALAIKMAVEFVGAVDEMNDHGINYSSSYFRFRKWISAT